MGSDLHNALLDAIATLRDWGQFEAAADLQASLEAGKIVQKSEPDVGAPVSTLVDALWIRPQTTPKAVRTGSKGNWMTVNTARFSGSGLSFEFDYGRAGLAVVLLHEWKHVVERLIPWDVVRLGPDGAPLLNQEGQPQFDPVRHQVQEDDNHAAKFGADIALIDELQFEILVLSPVDWDEYWRLRNLRDFAESAQAADLARANKRRKLL